MPACTVDHSLTPLLRLPGELLNKIYRLALVCPTPLTSYTVSIPIEDHKQNGDVYLKRQRTTAYPEAPGLLHTCSKIYGEASSIFWAENTFSFNLGRERLAERGNILRWLEGRNGFYLTSIKLHFSLDYTWARKTAPSKAGSLHIRCARLEVAYSRRDEVGYETWFYWAVDLTLAGALTTQCTCVLQRDLKCIAGFAGAAVAADRFEQRYLPSLDIRATEEYRSWPQFVERCAVCDKPKKEAMRGRYCWVTQKDLPVAEGEV